MRPLGVCFAHARAGGLVLRLPFVRRWSGRDRHAAAMLEGCFVGVSTFGPECRQL
jgi:hypothetical protein